jgi:hypothetical protein
MRDDCTDWTNIFGVIPPKLDPSRSCRCRCHHVVRNIVGTVVIEQRLGDLTSEQDHVMACSLCREAHTVARWQSKQKGAA